MQGMTPDLADRFAAIALGHVGREYPNAPGLVLSGPGDFAEPRALHPIFYGSFDWHSAVHSHWLLARLLRRFPQTGRGRRDPRAGSTQALTEDDVAGELAYLARPATAGFERPYGWAWLADAAGGARAHDDADGRRWADALRPLAGAFEQRFLAWLPKATYPDRVGHARQHGVRAASWRPLRAVRRRAGPRGAVLARRRTAGTRTTPTARPGSRAETIFSRPTLIEAAVHAPACCPAPSFDAWFARFLPRLAEGEPAHAVRARRGQRPQPTARSPTSTASTSAAPGACAAWRAPRRRWRARLRRRRRAHLAAALPHLAADYMGEHWLASFALLALDEV